MATRTLLTLLAVFGVWMAADGFLINGKGQARQYHQHCEAKLTAILDFIKSNDLQTIENALVYHAKDMEDCTNFLLARCPYHETLASGICSEYFNKKEA